MRAETPDQVSLSAKTDGVRSRRAPTVPGDRPRIDDPAQNLGDDINEGVPVPTMTREEMKALGYTPADEMEPLREEPPSPEPPPPVEPPEPSLFRPPMHNPGGVDGDRPPRPIPGISDHVDTPMFPPGQRPPENVFQPPSIAPEVPPAYPEDDPAMGSGSAVDPASPNPTDPE